MSPARRLFRSLVTALCFVILIASTARHADRASRAFTPYNQSGDSSLKLGSTTPPERFTLASLTRALRTPLAPGPQARLAWLFAVTLLALSFTRASTRRQFAATTRTSLCIPPQHSLFHLRL